MADITERAFGMLSWFISKRAKKALERGEARHQAEDWEAAKQEYLQTITWTAHTIARGRRDDEAMKGQAHLGLGRVCLQLKQITDAVHQFTLASSLLLEAWEPLYYRGCSEGRLGNLLKSEDSFTAALALAPTEVRIYCQRGHVRFKAGQLDLALADYLVAHRYGKLEGTDQLALAVLYLYWGEYAKAEGILRTLVAQECAEAYLLLGQALEKQKRWTDAAAIYERTTQVKELAPEAYERLGIVNTKVQRYEQACTWLAQAIRQGKDTDSVLFYYGWACYHLRRYEQCINLWQELRQRYPERQRLLALVQKVNYVWGCHLIRAGDYNAALQRWTDYYSRRENDELLARALAELHLRVAAQILTEESFERWEQAAEHLEEASQLSPDDSRFPFYLALLDMLDGYQANELLRKALALEPYNLRLRYYEALCTWQEGDEEQTEKKLKAVIAHDAGNHWGRRATESLAALYIQQGRWSEAADMFLSARK